LEKEESTYAVPRAAGAKTKVLSNERIPFEGSAQQMATRQESIEQGKTEHTIKRKKLRTFSEFAVYNSKQDRFAFNTGSYRCEEPRHRPSVKYKLGRIIKRMNGVRKFTKCGHDVRGSYL
jgi:hypothetical protein